MLIYPQFDPVAFHLGPISVHWYGIAYVVALILGLAYVKHLARRHPAPGITPDLYENLFTYVVIGVIAGGRLGYVLFYNPSHYFHDPLDILRVWNGGMSFHGGAIGVIIAMLWVGIRARINLADLADRVVPAVPIGLFLGRLANFINGELIGRPADPNLPWSMVFPQLDYLPRHPSQLYEAGLEGFLLFILLYLATRKSIIRWQPSGIFLTGYALARILVENFRTPEITHNLGFITLTQGQLLSLPMLAAGLYLLWLSARRPVIHV
jgi:phosphatidylglycerol:prolipoprotein diacylglycerol transferase